MTRWMLTGGAGYIGSHVARELLASGRDVIVLDNLSTGLRSRVSPDMGFVEADVADVDAVETALTDHEVDGVIHLAAKKSVGESVERPLYYFEQNVGGVIALLEAMDRAGVSKLVYSSSAAVYGEPTTALVDEDSPTVPANPYGETKLIGEWAGRSQANASRKAGIPFADISLRYFNVAGAGAADLGDTSVGNLIPLAFRAITSGQAPRIFGDDYPTADGTCIRDYIHVGDLANAHVRAAQVCETNPNGSAIFNIGTGDGYSVKQVLDVVATVTGFAGEPIIDPRRPGDPAALVAATGRVNSELGWRAERSLTDMVASAWDAWT